MSSIFLGEPKKITDILRRSAQKQLDSYADAWIMMFELLQNALDAVEKNATEKKVTITIHPGENEVIVCDNGSGFPTDGEIFTLGKGTKGDLRDPNIRGEHGVGMKMVILCSESFEVWTKTHSGKVWKADFRNGCHFLEEQESEKFAPDAQDSIIPPGFTTAVRVKFPKNPHGILRHIDCSEILIGILSQYANRIPHAVQQKLDRCALFLEHYFRTSSYTGDVNRLFDSQKPAELTLVVKKDDSLNSDELKKKYPELLLQFWEKPTTIVFPAKYWDPLEWFEDPDKKGFRTKKQLKTFNPGASTPGMLWALKLTSIDEFKLLLENLHIKDKYPAGHFDGLFAKRIRGIYLLIGSSSSSAKYNINDVTITPPEQIIAADGVVTTNKVGTPKRGKNQNYLNNVHFVVNINDRVNYGKQGVKNPILLKQLYDFFEEIYVKKIVDLASSVAGKRSGGGGPPAPSVEVVSLLDLDEPKLSVKKVPQFENTLIAIVHELIALGRITGLSSYQLNSAETYDCMGIVARHKHPPINPTRDSDLANIEYKVNLVDLISDIELGIKDASEIHLAVVWNDELPTTITSYGFLDLEQSTCDDLNVTNVDRVLRRYATGTDIPVLAIRPLVKIKAKPVVPAEA